MTLVQNILVFWGLALVSLFSLADVPDLPVVLKPSLKEFEKKPEYKQVEPLEVKMEITKSKGRYDPPVWLSARALEYRPIYKDPEHFVYVERETVSVIGTPHKSTPLYPCLKTDNQGDKKWQFCAMP